MNPSEPPSNSLAAQARQVFVRELIDHLPQVAERVQADLQQRLDGAVFGEAAQVLNDTLIRLRRLAPRWLELARERLSRSLKWAPAARAPEASALSLLGEEVVENQILTARAALAALDKGSEALNELRLRLQRLELTDGLDPRDPVQAANAMQALVDAWLAAELTRAEWQACQHTLHAALAQAVAQAYQDANRFLLTRGVLPEIDLRELVRRSGRADAASPRVAASPVASSGAPSRHSGLGGLTHVMPLSSAAARGGAPVPAGPSVGGDALSQLSSFVAQRVPGLQAWLQPSPSPGPASGGAAPGGVAPEVPMAPGPAPAWLRSVAVPAVDWSSLDAGAAGVKAQARALKQAASTDEEKALIELVALIFDGILSEDRIPASIRVWFARLQMPVLRHALSDPTFLSSEAHPARVLIDRMGACVLGFDPTVPLVDLEAEIKRIVQVIEQYPETGRRVFELMLDEFQGFLGQAVRQQPQWRRVTDVATQLEQRGTLTVQYTIELRRLLDGVPVHDGLRDFLFQTWAEVMAQAAVAYGPDDERAKRVRQLAADLLWAAGAKPSRHERAQVIARVPGLMGQLRDGLALLGLDAERQEAAIQPVSEALAAAFVARTAPIDAGWLSGLTEQLERLEGAFDASSDEPVPLDRDSIELLTGEDASQVTVLPNPEQPVPKHLLAWAAALPVGGGFRLDHNGQEVTVQLVWVSPRRQLYLLAPASRQAYLLTQARVAQYLKAGLLRATQSEPLTAQASRQALEKLQANPERLLA